MNEQRIREIASQCSDFAEQIPYFRGIEDGLTWEAKIQKARDLKFAELIIRECMKLNCEELSIVAIERLMTLYREHWEVEL